MNLKSNGGSAANKRITNIENLVVGKEVVLLDYMNQHAYEEPSGTLLWDYSTNMESFCIEMIVVFLQKFKLMLQERYKIV